jgi:hypothetical protein
VRKVEHAAVIVWRSMFVFPVVTALLGLDRLLRAVGGAAHRVAERVSDASDAVFAWGDPQDLTGHQARVQDLNARRKLAIEKSYAEYERWMA